MGMDGLSFAGTGAIKEQTSAEYTNKLEQTIAADSANSSQQVQVLANNQRVREKDEEEEGNAQHGKQNLRDNEEFQDGLVEENETQEETSEIDVEDFENPNKDFYVKLNIKDDIIELYDSTTDRLVETISGGELGELVQKLNMASGIFINKKV